jgi:hypothetical protein
MYDIYEFIIKNGNFNYRSIIKCNNKNVIYLELCNYLNYIPVELRKIIIKYYGEYGFAEKYIIEKLNMDFDILPIIREFMEKIKQTKNVECANVNVGLNVWIKKTKRWLTDYEPAFYIPALILLSEYKKYLASKQNYINELQRYIDNAC